MLNYALRTHGQFSQPNCPKLEGYLDDLQPLVINGFTQSDLCELYWKKKIHVFVSCTGPCGYA